jgi:glycosyltransferase involved in cell wall biosynthesis
MAPTVEASETLSPAVDRPPWVRFSGILHKIERRRLMGASWKEVIFLSAKFAYFRMLRRSRISSTPRHDIQLAESTTAEPAPEPAPSVFAQRPPEEAEGVNIMLYAGDPGGVLNVSSYYIRSLIRKNVPVAIVDIEQGAVSNALPHDLNVFLHPAPIYPINVWCIGFPFLSHHIATFHDWTENRWNVNFTHWELPYVPRRLWDNFKAVDAIIVDSEFVQSAIQDATDKPIILVDPEVEIPAFMIDRYDRAHFGLPDSKVLFLLNWEFTSSTIRKNPEASIKAFSEAFDDLRRDVALVMHVKFEFRHGEDQRANYEAFIAQIKRVHSNIIVLEKNSYTYDEALALKSLCDCYVSLHRAEGYGMGCAEALALGRRCVMTGWSGNMELLKNPRWRDMAFPVAVALVPVTPEDYPWVDSEDEVMQLWADPRHGDAVRQLKRAYEAIISTQEMT